MDQFLLSVGYFSERVVHDSSLTPESTAGIDGTVGMREIKKRTTWRTEKSMHMGTSGE